MKRKIAEQSSCSVSHSNQEQLIRPTSIKKFKMSEEDDISFCSDVSEDDKENDEVDLF